MSDNCWICKKSPSLLVRFTCDHSYCPDCLFRKIFIEDIPILENLNIEQCFCSCSKKGSFSIDLRQLNSIFNDYNPIKSSQWSSSRNETKKCNKHNDILIEENFCTDCNTYVCINCTKNKEDEHYFHLIKNSKKYISELRFYRKFIPLQYKTFDEFQEHFEEIGKKMTDLIEGSYKSTIEYLDSAVEALENFRSEYITKYKNKLQQSVYCLKIIKLFYLNFYYDYESADNSNDIYLLKYINQINFELDDVKMVHNNEISKKIKNIKEQMDKMKTDLEHSVELSMSFKRIEKGFQNIQVFDKAHTKTISSIVPLNDSTFVSGARDYTIKFWEEIDNSFQNTKTIKESTGSILFLCILENKTLLTSAFKDPAIKVWMKEHDNDDYSFQQSLTAHTDLVTHIVQLMDRKRFASASRDQKIIIWREDEGNYQVSQELTKHNRGIYAMTVLYDSRIVSGSEDGHIIVWKETDKQFYAEQMLYQHERGIWAICQLNDGRIVSGGEDDFMLVWKEDNGLFQLEHKISEENVQINAIIQLRDGRFASASGDTTIIWEKGKNGKIKKSEVLTGHGADIYTLVQLNDGRLCSGGADGSIRVWKNLNIV